MWSAASGWSRGKSLASHGSTRMWRVPSRITNALKAIIVSLAEGASVGTAHSGTGRSEARAKFSSSTRTMSTWPTRHWCTGTVWP